jgi:hypothetical protein
MSRAKLFLELNGLIKFLSVTFTGGQCYSFSDSILNQIKVSVKILADSIYICSQEGYVKPQGPIQQTITSDNAGVAKFFNTAYG